MTEAELLDLKRTLTPAILNIKGVSGLGVGDSRLNVYLERDDSAVRTQVESTVSALAGDIPIHFVVSGPFTPQSNG